MARVRALTETDAAVWASFASRIRPLSGPTPISQAEPAAAAPTPGKLPVQTRPTPAQRPTPVQIGGQPAGVDTGTWQRFHRGKMAQARRLDLHGMTAQAAFHSLRAFLRTAHAERLRCVEVITGRGSGERGGVLWREFPMWLNLPEIRPLILAASHPHAANAGSVRLLLRRTRP